MRAKLEAPLDADIEWYKKLGYIEYDRTKAVCHKWNDVNDSMLLEYIKYGMMRRMYAIHMPRDPIRRTNMKIMKNRFGPRFSYFIALDWKLHWSLISKFFIHFKIPITSMPFPTKGKHARWASLLMALKYIIDMDIDNHVVLLEDDVLLPSNFDFGLIDTIDDPFVKWSRWGEAYGIHANSARRFIYLMYHIGINEHDDNWILDNMQPFNNIIVHDEHVVVPTNHGNILHTNYAKWPWTHEVTNQGNILVNTKLFFSNDAIDFPKILERFFLDK